MRKGTLGLLGVAALALAGCATTFYGSARVEKGPRGCWEQCQAWGMDLVGMVKMGEYSDGCICQVRSASKPEQGQAPGADARSPMLDGPAVAGVWMQMQAAAATAAQSSSYQLQQRQGSGMGSTYGGGYHHP